MASTSVFDPRRLLAYARKVSAEKAFQAKIAISKVLGVYDAGEQVVHIDDSVGESKQRFLTLHETGHHEIPAHRKAFHFFQDCRKTLAPEIADLFEREANNFARFVLFQGDAYQRMAADSAMKMRTVLDLAKGFNASIYASAREFTRTNHRACAVYVLEPTKFVEGHGAEASVRRIECSPSYLSQFGRPADTVVTPDHILGPVLPIGRRMTRPTEVCASDRNGERHDCVAEAFSTKWNTVILLYPVESLTASSILVPAGFEDVVAGE